PSAPATYPLPLHDALPILTLPAEIADALGRLSHQEGATPFMTLLAAFKVLLGRYSGQDDIVVGSPIAGRNRAEIEHLIGFFINRDRKSTRLSSSHVKISYA